MSIQARVLVWLSVASWLTADVALACSPPPPELSVSQRFANAATVFHAHITKAEISAEHPFVVEATFRVVETFKGAPPAKVRSSVFRPGACGFPLLVGIDHLFFLADGQIDVWLNDNSVGLCTRATAGAEIAD